MPVAMSLSVATAQGVWLLIRSARHMVPTLFSGQQLRTDEILRLDDWHIPKREACVSHEAGFASALVNPLQLMCQADPGTHFCWTRRTASLLVRALHSDLGCCARIRKQLLNTRLSSSSSLRFHKAFHKAFLKAFFKALHNAHIVCFLLAMASCETFACDSDSVGYRYSLTFQ